MNDSIFFKRQSKRSFLEQSVPQNLFDAIYEIIRWSPSCGNRQPWRIVFVQERKQKEKLAGALSRGNAWAAKAPVLVAVCGRQEDDNVRKDDPIAYYQFDCGMATLSLLLGAVEHGLMAHPMAGYRADEVKEALDIPSEYHVLCLVALGYQGPLEQLDEATRKKDEAPRTRKDIAEIIAVDRFAF